MGRIKDYFFTDTNEENKHHDDPLWTSPRYYYCGRCRSYKTTAADTGAPDPLHKEGRVCTPCHHTLIQLGLKD